MLKSTQMRNNHESTYFNLIGHFLEIFGILKINASSTSNFDILANIQLKP